LLGWYHFLGVGPIWVEALIIICDPPSNEAQNYLHPTARQGFVHFMLV
jgi:hypothetical protein